MVEAGEFPHLSHKYDVFAVPKVIINEKHSFEGALPEESFIAEGLKASEF
jgi:predicted DsbA family dithiol-disulfide isomerase